MDKALLGKKLFFDPIISKDSSISCSACHTLPGNGANSTPFSFGVDGIEGDINTPTVLNAVFNFRQFWDGRAKDLKEQAIFPIENPKEMAIDVDKVVLKLKKSSYKKEFEKIYKDGVTINNLADVLSEFQTALITPNSRFDKYLRGDENAITSDEKEGYKQFVEIGCISCHNGVNIGGNMYQKLGVAVPALEHYGKKDYKKAFDGRINVTKRPRDKNVYKVPTLRNIELTAPYYHDGSINSLIEVIADMKEHQLGIVGDEQSGDKIELFLKTLTGEMPEILKGDE